MTRPTASRSLRTRRAFRPGLASADAVAWITTILLTLALLGIVARVAQLQLSPSPKLVEHVDPRKTVKRDLPLRGDILDRRGRLLATSRVGYRAVVDPERFPSPPDAAIVALAGALNLPPEEVGERIVSRLAINAQRRPALEAAKASLEEPDSSIRRRMIEKVEASRCCSAMKPRMFMTRYVTAGTIIFHEWAIRKLNLLTNVPEGTSLWWPPKAIC